MSELKLTEKGEKWISELTEQLSDGTEKLIILEPEQCKGLHLVLSARNTRTAAPRFTAEEREAMERVTDKAECLNLDGCDGCSHWNYVGSCKHFISEEELLCAIATVRAMLTASEIADKGKG